MGRRRASGGGVVSAPTQTVVRPLILRLLRPLPLLASLRAVARRSLRASTHVARAFRVAPLVAPAKPTPPRRTFPRANTPLRRAPPVGAQRQITTARPRLSPTNTNAARPLT